jgi:hypothetical protein
MEGLEEQSRILVGAVGQESLTEKIRTAEPFGPADPLPDGWEDVILSTFSGEAEGLPPFKGYVAVRRRIAGC